MTFNLPSGGDTITQSATDADCSDLAAVAGVTASVSVDGITTTYHLGSLKLKITGTITIHPEREKITSTAAQGITKSATGIIRVDGKITHGAGKETTYSTAYFYENSYEGTGGVAAVSKDHSCFYSEAGGTVDWQGGRIKSKAPIVFSDSISDTTSVIKITKGGWNARGFFSTYPSMVRMFPKNVTVDGFEFVNGGSMAFFNDYTGGMKNLTFNAAYGIGFSGYSKKNIWYELHDYISTNPEMDAGLWQKTQLRFLNAEKGSDQIVMGLSSKSDAANRGTVEMVRQARFHLEGEDENHNHIKLKGVKVLVIDTDDGHRTDGEQHDGTAIKYTDDRTSLHTTDDQGETPVIDVLLASVARKTGGARGTNNTGDNKKSYRGIHKDNTDVFPVHFGSYHYELHPMEYGMKGTGVMDAHMTLTHDPLITEEDRSIIDVPFRHVADAKDLYDSMKNWLYNNWGTAYHEMPLTRVGDTIRTDKDIEFGGATPDALTRYDAVTDKVTVRGTNFVGNVETKGRFTIDRNVNFRGYVLSSANDSCLIFDDSISSWKTYPTLNDMVKDTNPTAGSGVIKRPYLFKYDPNSNVLYVRMTVKTGGQIYGETVFKSVYVTKGINNVTFNRDFIISQMIPLIERSTGEILRRLVAQHHDIKRTSTHELVKFIPNDANVSKFTLTSPSDNAGTVTRSDDVLTLPAKSRAVITVPLDPTWTKDSYSFSFSTIERNLSLSMELDAIDSSNKEHLIGYDDTIYGQWKGISISKKKGVPTDDIKELKITIRNDVDQDSKIRMGEISVGRSYYQTTDTDLYPRVNVAEWDNNAVVPLTDIGGRYDDRLADIQESIYQNQEALLEIFEKFVPNDSSSAKFNIMGATRTDDEFVFTADIAAIFIPVQQFHEFEIFSAHIIGNDETDNTGVKMELVLSNPQNINTPIATKETTRLEKGQHFGITAEIPDQSNSNNSGLGIKVTRLGNTKLAKFRMGNVLLAKRREEADITEVNGTKVVLADLQGSASGTSLTKSDVQDAVIKIAQPEKEKFGRINTKAEIKAGATEAITDLSSVEKEKFGKKNTKDEIKVAAAEAITNLSLAEKEKFGQKNTKTEIKTGVTDALQDLPDNEKEKYGKDTTTDISEIKFKIGEIKPDVRDIKTKVDTNLDKKISDIQDGTTDLTATNAKIDSVKGTVETTQVDVIGIKVKTDNLLDKKISDIQDSIADLTITNAKIDEVKKTVDAIRTTADGIKITVDGNIDLKLSDMAAIITSVQGDVTLIKKLKTSKWTSRKIDDTTYQLTSYDTDGTTILLRQNVTIDDNTESKDIVPV